MQVLVERWEEIATEIGVNHFRYPFSKLNNYWIWILQ